MQQNTEKSMRRQHAYWRRVQRLTSVLLATWFITTFVTIFFARELSGFTLFGWPFPFYMAAQGLTVLYVAIVAVYALRMRALDKLIHGGDRHVE